MFIKDIDFTIIRSEYSKRKHFIKYFLKKYHPSEWEETEKAFYSTLEKSFRFQQTRLMNPISLNYKDNCGIFKLKFRGAKTSESAKDSGNRLIFFVDNENELIEILIIYGKNHCPKGQHETQWIKEQIKENFPKYKKYCV